MFAACCVCCCVCGFRKFEESFFLVFRANLTNSRSQKRRTRIQTATKQFARNSQSLGKSPTQRNALAIAAFVSAKQATSLCVLLICLASSLLYFQNRFRLQFAISHSKDFSLLRNLRDLHSSKVARFCAQATRRESAHLESESRSVCRSAALCRGVARKQPAERQSKSSTHGAICERKRKSVSFRDLSRLFRAAGSESDVVCCE